MSQIDDEVQSTSDLIEKHDTAAERCSGHEMEYTEGGALGRCWKCGALMSINGHGFDGDE